MAQTANSAVHIPPPADWQAFERGSAILWGRILKDDSLNRFGRSGQAQHGMDMYGYRDHDPAKLVGIQCKCKGHGEQAADEELRTDFEKALKFQPALTEYIFTTTAPDHGPLQALAAALTQEQRLKGRSILVRAWGWGTLEQRLTAYPDIAGIFDPNHSPMAEAQAQHNAEVMARFDRLEQLVDVSRPGEPPTVDVDSDQLSGNIEERLLDQEIDRYRDYMRTGRPKTALAMLEGLQSTLKSAQSGHIWFRVKANIAHCHLNMGDEHTAAELLDEAVAYAPEDPKALANSVLARILRKDYQGARDLALPSLSMPREINQAVAGYAIQAAGYLGLPDLSEGIPADLCPFPDVQHNLVAALRNNNRPEWLRLAKDGKDRHPDDEFFRRYAADADLSEIIDGEFDTTWTLTAEERGRLERAADVLSAVWDKARSNEVPYRSDNLAAGTNAATALVMLGRGKEAKRLIEQAIEVTRDHPEEDLVIRAAAVSLEIGDRQWGADLFSQLPTEGPGLLMRVQIAGRAEDWDYLAEIVDTGVLDTIPEPDREMATALSLTAKARLIARTDRAVASTRLADLVDRFAKNARASVVVVRAATDLGLPDLAERAYANAIATVVPTSHAASRMMLANVAADRDDHRTVIRVLTGYVDTSRPSQELFQLASAYAYEFPTRVDGPEFFKSLPDVVRQDRAFVKLEGILHYHRGDLPAAEERFDKAHNLEPRELQPLLMLVQTLMRQGRTEQLEALVKGVAPATMVGSPIDRINLAHVIDDAGRTDDALKLGYSVLESNRNSAEVNLKWIGLTFPHLDRLIALSQAPLDVGMWVQLTSDDKQASEFLIIDGPSDLAAGIRAKDHPIAARAMGKQVGESFDVPDGLGGIRTWTLQLVRHRYLQAHFDITENFNTRFPDNKGFFVVRTEENDTQQVIDVIRRQSEGRERVLGYYGKSPVPIAFIAEAAGTDAIAFAESLRVNDISMETCDGTLPERLAAWALIRKHVGKGVVLDAVTFSDAVGLGALDAIKAMFGEVYIPQSVVDQIHELRERGEKKLGGERSASAFFRDGRFYFEEVTPDRERAREQAIDLRLKAIAECRVVPAQAPDDMNPIWLERFPRGSLDPVLVARERGLLLLSDDKWYRAWASTERVPGTWLQAVLMIALKRRLVSTRRYALLIADLAGMKHTSVSCNAADFVNLVEQASEADRARIYALAHTLGVKNADVSTHLAVLKGVVSRLWSETPVPLLKQWATAQLLDATARLLPRRLFTIGDLQALMTSVGGREFFDRWKIGHFVLEPLREDKD